MEIGLEYILNNKKERVRKINDFMYFLIKNNKVVYTIYGNAHERKILSISHNRNINSKIFYTKDGSFEIEPEFIEKEFFIKEWSSGLVTEISTSMDRLLLEMEEN